MFKLGCKTWRDAPLETSKYETNILLMERKETSTERAAIYARVSTDDQRGNYSIPTQVAECQDYAKEQGYTVVADRFVDPQSGRDTVGGNGAAPAYVDDYSSRELSRPSLDAVYGFLESAGFDVLIVHAIDRLARDPYIRTTIEREISGLGARVEYVLGNYEDTPEGEVRKDLDATFAKWENAKRVERCNRGKRRKAESGLFVGGRSPFGYTICEESKGGLKVNESQAIQVRRIFNLYTNEGKSIRAIAKTLTAERIPNYFGKPNWGKTSVARILKNTAYSGYLYYNKSERKGNGFVKRDQKEWIKIATTQIVELEQFEDVQKKLARNKSIKRREPKRFYLLGGMVFCTECGRPYFSQTAKAGKNRRISDAQSYRHRASEGHCMNRMISARTLETIVWDEVVNILLDPEHLRQGYEESVAQQEVARSKQESHLETLRRAVIKLEKQRDTLTSIYIDPEIQLTKNEYITQKERIDDNLKVVSNDIVELEGELTRIPTLAEFETLETFSTEIGKTLGSDFDFAKEEKKKVLEALNIRAMIGIDGDIRLDGWIAPGDSLLSPTLVRCGRPRRRLPRRV